jgi:Domain of unknown function (DUF4352)
VSKKRVIVILFMIMGVFVLLVPLIGALNRPPKVVGLNTPIQFDDFAFTVSSVRPAQALGTGNARRPADGQYLIVSLTINNKAKRVNYVWKNSTAILVDDSGQEHHVSTAGQAALESEPGKANPCAGPIPAGTACTKELVFDVPTAVRSPRFRISFGPVGDALESLFFGRKAIQLP